MLGGVRVDDPDLEAGGGEGEAGEAGGEVIASGPLDGDNEVGQAVFGGGPPDRGDGGVEVGPGVRGDGRKDEDFAIEVGEHPFAAGLGAVDADDAEVLGPGALDP